MKTFTVKIFLIDRRWLAIKADKTTDSWYDQPNIIQHNHTIMQTLRPTKTAF